MRLLHNSAEVRSLTQHVGLEDDIRAGHHGIGMVSVASIEPAMKPPSMSVTLRMVGLAHQVVIENAEQHDRGPDFQLPLNDLPKPRIPVGQHIGVYSQIPIQADAR